MRVRPDFTAKNEDARQAMDKMDVARRKLRELKRRGRLDLAHNGIVDDLTQVEDLIAEVQVWMWSLR